MEKQLKKKSIHNVFKTLESKPKASVLNHKCQRYLKRSFNKSKQLNHIHKPSLPNLIVFTKMLKGDKKGKNSFTAPALNQNARFSLIPKRLDSLILKLL